MKKQFKVFLHKLGSENEAILTMIANHNSGAGNLTLPDIAGYLNARKVLYPSIYKKNSYVFDEANLSLDIKEGDEFTLHIEEVEVYELNPVNN